jgi:putative acetyltransferase
MIRAVKENDLSAVMQIWLDINIKAHSFISKHYWMDNYDMVKKILPQAEIYVYENNGTKEIEGFIGLTDNCGIIRKRRYAVERHWETTIELCKRH